MQAALYDRFTRTMVSAEITAMSHEHIRLANSTWAASFQQRYRLHEHDEDSWMWNTSNDHLELFLQRSQLRSYALLSEQMILGVLLLKCETHLSRLRYGLPLVYVNYVATAPWNRLNKCEPGRLKGVGTSLMALASQLSRDAGCDGRIGLHSLRSSDKFYHRLHFHNLGIDPAHRGMTYFEQSDSLVTVV